MALLIGNARYKTAPLVNPIHDVRLLADVLASLGFEVTCVENAARPKLREAVDDFAARLEEIGPNGVAFFYFAGHGIQDGGVNFLLPVDLEQASRSYLRARALAVDEVVTQMARSPRKANVIVLDACRTPPKDVVAEDLDLTQGLAALKLPPDGMLVVYSTAVGALAEDGKATNSPYTAALAQALPGVLEPDRRLHDVFVEAAERVKADTEGRQNPALYLQGALPPLAVTEADRERFRKWVFRRPKSWRERIFQWVGILFLATVALAFLLAWYASGPERRAYVLHNLHITRNPTMFEFSCKGPSEAKDRFGLTRFDWCTKAVKDLVPIVRAAGLWESAVLDRLAVGDPGAMVLRSADIASSGVGSGKSGYLALRLAVRAARVGWLPAWPEVHRRFYASRENERLTSAAKILAGLQAGAKANLVPAWIAWGLHEWREGNIKIAERIFRYADNRDPSGNAALIFGRQLLSGSAKSQTRPNATQAAEWFKKSCRKGAGGALAQLDALGAKQLTSISAGERAACVTRVIAAGGPESHYLRGIDLNLVGPKRNPEAAAREFLLAASAGHVEGMVQFALLHINGQLGPKSQPNDGFEWLRKAELQGSILAKTLVGEQLAWGLPDAQDKPLIAIDIQAGRNRLQQALSSFEPFAGLALARLHETGALGGRRDPREVIRLANSAKNIGAGTLSLQQSADVYIARAQNELKLRFRDSRKITLGETAATIKVVLLIPWGCDHCLAFIKDEMQALLKEYVHTGVVELELRPVYGPDAVDRTALVHAIMHCVPSGARANYFVKLLENYRAWSTLPEDARTVQLREMAQPYLAGGVCLPNEKIVAATRIHGPKSAERWGVKGDLIVAVNGEVLTRPALLDVRKAVYSMAGPEVRPKLEKP